MQIHFHKNGKRAVNLQIFTKRRQNVRKFTVAVSFIAYTFKRY